MQNSQNLNIPSCIWPEENDMLARPCSEKIGMYLEVWFNSRRPVGDILAKFQEHKIVSICLSLGPILKRILPYF